MDEERKQEMVKDALVAIEHLSNLNLYVLDSETREQVSGLLFHTINNIVFCLHKSYDEVSWNEFAEEASKHEESPAEILARRKPDLN
tara:strand:+ start:208 stop:468 length:261 start_codon:yes stop_codon:yes gene_type:complete